MDTSNAEVCPDQVATIGSLVLQLQLQLLLVRHHCRRLSRRAHRTHLMRAYETLGQGKQAHVHMFMLQSTCQLLDSKHVKGCCLLM
jgi:hypothetical protein